MTNMRKEIEGENWREDEAKRRISIDSPDHLKDTSMTSIKDLDRFRGLSGGRALLATRAILKFATANVMYLSPEDVRKCLSQAEALLFHLSVAE